MDQFLPSDQPQRPLEKLLSEEEELIQMVIEELKYQKKENIDELKEIIAKMISIIDKNLPRNTRTGNKKLSVALAEMGELPHVIGNVLDYFLFDLMRLDPAEGWPIIEKQLLLEISPLVNYFLAPSTDNTTETAVNQPLPIQTPAGLLEDTDFLEQCTGRVVVMALEDNPDMIKQLMNAAQGCSFPLLVFVTEKLVQLLQSPDLKLEPFPNCSFVLLQITDEKKISTTSTDALARLIKAMNAASIHILADNMLDMMGLVELGPNLLQRVFSSNDIRGCPTKRINIHSSTAEYLKLRGIEDLAQQRSGAWAHVPIQFHRMGDYSKGTAFFRKFFQGLNEQ